MRCLTDLDDLRLAHMDEAGIDMQVLALTSPGVQVMDTATAVVLRAHRQRLPGRRDPTPPDALRRHDRGRAAGSGAPRPRRSSAASRKLGLRSVVINSHTQGEYLSDPKFWEIFAAAEALDVPIYLHPNTLPPKMIAAVPGSGLDGAIYGFGVETGLHALRIITAGVFDRFPKLQMILGHMGEALPFWAYRLDYMHRATVARSAMRACKPLQQKPSDYLRENFYITNSGVAWEPAIKFTQRVRRHRRVLYAMDYPYQHAVDEVHTLDGMVMDAADKKNFLPNQCRTFVRYRNGGRMKRARIQLLLGLVAGALSLAPLGLRAQTAPAGWPTQPIKFVVPFTPGTGMDTIARAVAPRLQRAPGPAGGGGEHARRQRQHRRRQRGQGRCRTATPC